MLNYYQINTLFSILPGYIKVYKINVLEIVVKRALVGYGFWLLAANRRSNAIKNRGTQLN